MLKYVFTKVLASVTVFHIRWPWKTTLSLWVSCIDVPCCTNILTQTFGLCLQYYNSTSYSLCHLCLDASPVKPLHVSDVLLNTGCPDCLVVYAKYPAARKTYRGLQLLSKSLDMQADKRNARKKLSHVLKWWKILIAVWQNLKWLIVQ